MKLSAASPGTFRGLHIQFPGFQYCSRTFLYTSISPPTSLHYAVTIQARMACVWDVPCTVSTCWPEGCRPATPAVAVVAEDCCLAGGFTMTQISCALSKLNVRRVAESGNTRPTTRAISNNNVKKVKKPHLS